MTDDWTTADGRRVRIVDADTGEVLDTDAFMVEKAVPAGRDYWWRFMVCDLVRLMDDLPGKQIHAVSTILDNVEPWTNGINKTLVELAKQAKCSEKTMREAMNSLIDHGIVKRIGHGRYMIDPRFMSQGGGRRKFTTLAIRYDSAGSGNLRVVDGGSGHAEAMEG